MSKAKAHSEFPVIFHQRVSKSRMSKGVQVCECVLDTYYRSKVETKNDEPDYDYDEGYKAGFVKMSNALNDLYNEKGDDITTSYIEGAARGGLGGLSMISGMYLAREETSI